MANNISSFTAGDLVVSVYGDGDGSGNYTDNQASPITLEELTTSGTVVGQLVLPQTANGANGAISGEYGSSSEGTLELSGDGQSLTIGGYGVSAATYNSGGAAVYGNAALAQSTSVKGGSATAVPRVAADIRYDGTIDTSTALYNIYNTNNIRSVATTNGSTFYMGGQGVKGDTTQGVFSATDGASSATAINTADDARTVELYNGSLLVSQDSKQPSNGGTSNISTFASAMPTSQSSEATLPGISQTVAIAAGQGNGLNDTSGTVHISPENFFFANASTLYVADGGLPKQGGIGDGGLQKWSLVGGAWKLDYTLSAGLGLVNGTTATAGTTGLIGLTGSVSGDTVSLYATNSSIGDTDPTFLYGITDSLAATTNAGQSFTTLLTAAPDTNIRGVAFAPQAACFATGTRIATARGDVAIEALVVGDHAVTASGALRTIRWIGHRTLDCRRHPRPHDAMPVRIAAHAFGANRPARDLHVSPGHAICVDLLGEVLMPAIVLANGSTIRQVDVDQITYWHVELDSHDILLSENLPSESYLDMGNRGFFTEGDVVELATGPDADAALRTNADFCRPYHSDGVLVDAVRVQLRRQAEALGWTRSAASLADIHLLVDGVRLEPRVRGLSACFAVPAGARDIWLISETARPRDTMDVGDSRRLGLFIGGLTIDDGFSLCQIALDDPRLDVGFHGVEGDAGGLRRWTEGRARLAADLWERDDEPTLLRVDLATPCLPRWIEPCAEIDASRSETSADRKEAA